MKISRSRCYKFLRRVFHYQNGSGSDLGPNPFDSGNWMLMEFMALVVQISLTCYTLIISKEERPVWPMRLWLLGYAFGCFVSLVHLYWRYRNLQYMQKCKTSLELLFAIWFVMGNVWVFDSRFASYHRAPKLHVLCISLLAWNAVSYSFPFILFVLLCCCVPLLSTLLGYNMNAGSLQRGATEEQLASLPSWKYKDVIGNALELGNSAKNQQVPVLAQDYLLLSSLLEEMESGKKPRKFSGPCLNIAEIKKQSIGLSNIINVASPAQSVASPAQGGAAKPPQSAPPLHCLCSPTTHAGSFRCRHHRNAAQT
ncbi:hypothetical protein DH2020_042402 [Rehmannia glutinosa]|uniref:Uncharacterized protein n=1 Tax=Rehmannia glutinosa TaxID=99300 RepID=A0ABR0UPI9_REHGL